MSKTNRDLILEKLIEHIDGDTNPLKSSKIFRIKKTQTPQNKTPRYTKSLDLENENAKKRRQEMLCFIEEMNSLELYAKVDYTSSKNNKLRSRQKELLYVKAFLQEEMRQDSLFVAS